MKKKRLYQAKCAAKQESKPSGFNINEADLGASPQMSKGGIMGLGKGK